MQRESRRTIRQPATIEAVRRWVWFETFSYSYSESLAEQKHEVLESVAPWSKFLLAEPLRIADENFTEANIPILYSFNLDFFTECHSVARQVHFVQHIPPKDPHSGLRIMNPSEEQ